MLYTLDNDENGKHVFKKQFRCTIGSLLHLTTSRRDIVFAVEFTWLQVGMI